MERVNMDDALQVRIDSAREATLDWMMELRGAAAHPDAMRFDAGHDPARWPGMLLPATYNGVMCLHLLDGLAGVDRVGLSAWIGGFQRADGAFRIPGMTDANVFKKPDPAETWRYIDWHVTNYALGAQEALGTDVTAPAFVASFLDPMTLKAWLADRDLRDPWQEGNNIVNLASFFLLIARHVPDRAPVDAALAILFDWHDRLQDPMTGFWGVGQGLGGQYLLHAMAGSMHNFHLWYATGRPLPFQDRAAAYVLRHPTTWHSACIDVDEVDLLVHAVRTGPAPAAEVASWLRAKLVALLDGQNPDGGFPDTRTGPWRQDGWTGGYAVAPGISTTFATWFRWIAIAMIDDHLWPGRRTWNFRRMIGIGYRQSQGGQAAHG